MGIIIVVGADINNDEHVKRDKTIGKLYVGYNFLSILGNESSKYEVGHLGNR
jgi:hypothetical protein